MPASDKVFLHYTQAELDRNYDQRAWAPDSASYIARFVPDSAATREALPHKTFAYGPDPDEVLDVFLASAGAPTVVFVHGGAWRNFDKSNFSFMATPFVRAGFHCAVVNFSKLPARRLPDVVDQLRRALTWIHGHRQDFGGSPTPLYLCGNSSGAHLSAVVLTTPMTEKGWSSDVICGASLISGSYDLAPALLSKRGDYISVSADEQRALSPLFLADRIRCPVLVAYAENDTDEFRRQSAAFSDALKCAGKLVESVVVPGVNHFSILYEMSKPESELFAAIAEHARRSTNAS